MHLTDEIISELKSGAIVLDSGYNSCLIEFINSGEHSGILKYDAKLLQSEIVSQSGANGFIKFCYNLDNYDEQPNTSIYLDGPIIFPEITDKRDPTAL
jgi:hypothetical protein